VLVTTPVWAAQSASQFIVVSAMVDGGSSDLTIGSAIALMRLPLSGILIAAAIGLALVMYLRSKEPSLIPDAFIS